MMTTAEPFKYRAFLSYSHKDTKWAKRLHKSLENFRIAKDLRGRETSAGPIPKSLRPIFRDREDFSAGHSLTDQTIAALNASSYLIVLCSENSAKSAYVNEEVRLFKASGRSEAIIPVIISGEPGNEELECFVPSLKYVVDDEGNVSESPAEVIAADVREDRDGWELGFAKIVARLIGLSSDEVYRRAERERRRKNRIRNAVIASLALLSVTATGVAFFAYQKMLESDERLDQAIEFAYRFVTRSTKLSETFGVPTSVSLGLLEDAESGLNDLLSKGKDSVKLRRRRGAMLIEFADNYHTLGRYEESRLRLNEAERIFLGLTKKYPDDPLPQWQLSKVYSRKGKSLLAIGRYSNAEKEYDKALNLRRILTVNYPDNVAWQKELAITLMTMSGFTSSSNDKKKLTSILLQNISYFEKHVSGGEDANSSARALAELYHSLARIYLEILSEEQALNYAKKSADLCSKFFLQNPDSSFWSYNLSQAKELIGEIYMKLGQHEEAEKPFKESKALLVKLVASDPSNVLWQKRLISAGLSLAVIDGKESEQKLLASMSELGKRAIVLEKKIAYDAEITALSAIFTISNVFKKLDQGDLLGTRILMAEIGEKLFRLADDPKAEIFHNLISALYGGYSQELYKRKHYDESLHFANVTEKFARRFAAINKTELSKIAPIAQALYLQGDAYLAKRDRRRALRYFQEGLSLWSKVAQKNPKNAEYAFKEYIGRKLSADIFKATERYKEALETYEDALKFEEIWASKLKLEDKDDHISNRTKIWGEIIDIHVKQNNHEKAEEAARRQLELNEQLVAKHPGKIIYRTERARSMGLIAESALWRDTSIALELAKKADDEHEKMLAEKPEFPENVLYNRSLFKALIAKIYLKNGDFDKGLKEYHETLKLYRQLNGKYEKYKDLRADDWKAEEWSANWLAKIGAKEDAVTYYKKAILKIDKHLRKNKKYAEGWRDKYEILRKLRLHYTNLKDYRVVLRFARKQRDTAYRLKALAADKPYWEYNIISAYWFEAEAHKELGNLWRSRKTFLKAHGIGETLTSKNDNLGYHSLHIGTNMALIELLQQMKRKNDVDRYSKKIFEYLLRTGDEALKKDNKSFAHQCYETMVEIADKQLAEEPDNSDWRIKRAQALTKYHHKFWYTTTLDKAIEQLEKARNIYVDLAKAQPDNAQWHKQLSYIDERRSIAFDDKRQLEKAAATMKDALEHAATFAKLAAGEEEAQIALATRHRQFAGAQKKLNNTEGVLSSETNALEIWKSISAKNPENVSHLASLWNAYDKVSKIYLNKKDYEKALQLRHDSLEVAEKLQTLRKDKSEWPKQTFQTLIAIGDVYRISKNYPASLENYSKAHKLAKRMVEDFPKNREFKKYLGFGEYGIGYGHVLNGDCKKAIPWLKKSEKRFEAFKVTEVTLAGSRSFKGQGYYRIGNCHSSAKQYDKSIISYGRALQFQPNFVRALNARAWSYFQRGDAELGLPDVERAIELDPNDSYALDSRAHIYEALGRTDEAIKDYVRTLELNPNIQESIEGLTRLGAQDQIPKTVSKPGL